jgi:hypothetical protein
MPKVKISEFDIDPANNTDINNINIAEGCAPSGINNAIRQLMSDLKEFQTGGGGDSMTAVGLFSDTVGEKTSGAGVTVDGVLIKDNGITASGAVAFNGGATLGDASGDALTINSSAVSIPNGLNFDSNTLVIDASGNNVGIGTGSPGSKLTVNDPGSGLQFTNAASGNFNLGLLAGVGGADAYVYQRANANLIIGTNNTERMRIDSSGNVGIGTSSPNAKLQVVGIVNAGALKASGASAATFSADSWFVQVESANTVRAYACGTNSSSYATFTEYSTTSTGSPVPTRAYDNISQVFYTNNIERMRIGSVGEVLIGSTSAASKLQVSGNSGSTITAVNNFSSGQSYLSTNTAAAGTLWFHFNGVSNSNTVQNIIIYGNGDVRNANGTYGTFSDARLKENIVDATPKLGDVLKLKVRNFNLIGEQESHKQIGFVAQEMEEVFPKLVDESIGIDGEPVKGIKTSVLIPILVKAIQEQQAIITDLKSRIEALENK